MFLIVLRSVAVYFATAGICLWAVHRFVTPLTRGVALAIAIAPFLLTGRATFTGAIYAPLDIVYRPIPSCRSRSRWAFAPRGKHSVGRRVPGNSVAKSGARGRQARRASALEPARARRGASARRPAAGGVPPRHVDRLSSSAGAGMDLRDVPADLPGAALRVRLPPRARMPDHPEPGRSRRVGLFELLVFFLGYPLSPAAAPFPLLLLGLRRLARGPGRGPVGIIVAALLLIVTSGHPESVLHTVAAAGLYFLYALYRAGSGNRGRAVVQSLGAGALTLGISAILLLPLAEALPHTIEHSFRSSWYAHQPRSHPWDKVLASVELEISPTAVKADVLPRKGEAPFGPYGYCGSLLLPLALTGLLGRRESRWFFASLGIGRAARRRGDAARRRPRAPAALRHRHQRSGDLRDRLFDVRPGGIRNGATPRRRGPSDLSRRLRTDGGAADLDLRPKHRRRERRHDLPRRFSQSHPDPDRPRRRRGARRPGPGAQPADTSRARDSGCSRFSWSSGRWRPAASTRLTRPAPSTRRSPFSREFRGESLTASHPSATPSSPTSRRCTASRTFAVTRP